MKSPFPYNFAKEQHLHFLKSLDARVNHLDYWQGEYLRMSGLYWALTALFIMMPELESTSPEFDIHSPLTREGILHFIQACQCSSGGFGGNIGGHDAHLTFTLSAIQILAMLQALDDRRFNWDQHIRWIKERQRENGSFEGDEYGEVDTRFSYCAIASLFILNRDPLESIINITAAMSYILACQNEDGGFGVMPGGESHSGQVFCCVGALRLASVDNERWWPPPRMNALVEWLAWRQLPMGGLNGRPEKLQDVCYSWWVVSSLAILENLSVIDADALQRFILKCQDISDEYEGNDSSSFGNVNDFDNLDKHSITNPQFGGIADRPGDVADVFHTVFGVTGLSLTRFPNLAPIDARLCLPIRHVNR